MIHAQALVLAARSLAAQPLATQWFDPGWRSVLGTPFMRNAALAGILISLAAGFIGYFVIARNSSFAAHALAHIGLPGATGAVLIGAPVSLGLGLFAMAGGLIIGALGRKASKRGIATGTILAFAMGLGLFFSRLSASASQQMQAILFGSILSITDSQLLGYLIFDIILFVVLGLVYHPLLFSSVDEQVARAKGVPTGLMGIIFMLMLAGTVTISVQAVGTLLIFALVVTPAASANTLARSPLSAMVWSCVICLISIWGGLVLSAMLPTPPSFAIVTIATLIWVVSQLIGRHQA
jgi:zinc/manganese transport system permease protein